MSWNITDRFPNWGEAGESPPDGFFYEGGDQVNEKHLDYLWNSVKGLEDEVQAALNDIDSDGDGTVDEAVNVINRYTDEEAQDAVAAALSGGDKVSVTYNDANDTLTIDTSALDTEEVDDRVSTLVNSDSNLSWTYDDANNSLTISLSGSISVSNITVAGADTRFSWVSESDSGIVADGDFAPVWITTLQNSETLKVTQAGISLANGSASPTDLDLIIANLTNMNEETELITSDGTLKTDITGNPVGQYQNTSGGEEQIAVGINNGEFGSVGSSSDHDTRASFVGRVV